MKLIPTKKEKVMEISTTAPADTAPSTLGALGIEVDTLNAEIQRLKDSRDYFDRLWRELVQKVDNVKGYMADIYSEDGEIDERVEEIANLLDIELTKEICGTAMYEITWSATVPLGFDPDDFEITFSVECDTYEADDFDYDETENHVSVECS